MIQPKNLFDWFLGHVHVSFLRYIDCLWSKIHVLLDMEVIYDTISRWQEAVKQTPTVFGLFHFQKKEMEVKKRGHSIMERMAHPCPPPPFYTFTVQIFDQEVISQAY